MKTWNVTITGADDRTEPDKLLRLSNRFPFVEWGILCSNKRAGTPRYPSVAWTLGFMNAVQVWDHKAKTALHLCGENARAFMAPSHPLAIGPCRIQVNGFDPDMAEGMARPRLTEEIILQCRSEETLQAVADFAKRRSGLMPSILYDVSGGRGIEPARWPRAPLGIRMGYAGGITPDNVLDALRDIGPVEPTWIDMESGVRTDDVLDLAKVEAVLSKVASLTH